MFQLPISAANSANFHTLSIISGIPFALGDISFIDRKISLFFCDMLAGYEYSFHGTFYSIN